MFSKISVKKIPKPIHLHLASCAVSRSLVTTEKPAAMSQKSDFSVFLRSSKDTMWKVLDIFVWVLYLKSLLKENLVAISNKFL